MKGLTLVLPYYENPTMFVEQQRVWAAYGRKRKDSLHVVVVDDGSPAKPARPHVMETGIASFRMYRILVDRRWNWLACRNLGASVATTQWVLFTDMDHVLPEDTFQALLGMGLDTGNVYRLSREDAPNRTPYKPHPNTWLMTRAMFDQIGGYDERFSGYYGTDGEFRDRVAQNAKSVVMLPQALIRYPREVIADASTTVYGRKEPQDGEAVPRIRAERNAQPDWRPLRGTFPWEQLV